MTTLAHAISEPSPTSSSPQAIVLANMPRSPILGTVGMAARLLTRIQSRLSALADCFHFGHYDDGLKLKYHIRSAARLSETVGEDKAIGRFSKIPSLPQAERTLVELEVYVLALAETLSQLRGEPFDVVAAAVEQSAQLHQAPVEARKVRRRAHAEHERNPASSLPQVRLWLDREQPP